MRFYVNSCIDFPKTKLDNVLVNSNCFQSQNKNQLPTTLDIAMTLQVNWQQCDKLHTDIYIILLNTLDMTEPIMYSWKQKFFLHPAK